MGANEPLNNLEYKLVGLLYTHEIDYPRTDSLADTLRAAFDELRGRRAVAERIEDLGERTLKSSTVPRWFVAALKGDSKLVPITISEDRGE